MKLTELNSILERVNERSENFDLFLETGSFMGETLSNVKTSFNKLKSIEITDKYYNYCKNKFAGDDNVEIIKGDCLEVIPKLLEEYKDKKVLFFLDGHYSAADTGKNHLDVPLIEELIIIHAHYNESTIIIVDDADLFEHTNPDLSWEGINENNIFEVLGNRIENHFYVNCLPPYAEKTRLIIELKKK
jgi:hypothetical protein